MNKGFMGGHIGVIGTGKLGSCSASTLGKGCPPGYIKNSRGICIVPPIPGRGYSGVSIGAAKK